MQCTAEAEPPGAATLNWSAGKICVRAFLCFLIRRRPVRRTKISPMARGRMDGAVAVWPGLESASKRDTFSRLRTFGDKALLAIAVIIEVNARRIGRSGKTGFRCSIRQPDGPAAEPLSDWRNKARTSVVLNMEI